MASGSSSGGSGFNPLSLITAPIQGAFDMAGGKAQADAATHAADLQSKSAADALAFQKQQAAQDFANAQTTAQANYGQWAARQGRLSTLGQMVGLQPFNIPAYVPMTQVADPTADPTNRTASMAALGRPNGN
jgi:hypothetical protein